MAARVTGDVTGDISIEPLPDLVSPAEEITGVSRLATAVEVATDGEVTGVIEVRLPLTAEVEPGSVVFALTADDADGPWELLPAEVDGNEVVIRSTHLSLFDAFVSPVGASVDLFEETLEGVIGDVAATADPPTCEDEAGAREDGHDVTSDSSDTVLWCLGRDAEGRFLRMVNNRRYALLVSHGEGVTDVVLDEVDVELSRVLADVLTPENQSMISPSASATFRLDLAEGQTTNIRTEVDGVGSAFAQLQFGIETLITILSRFGAGPAPGSPEARSQLLKVLAVGGCVEAVGTSDVGTIVAACFDREVLRDAFGSGAAALLTPVIAVGSLADFIMAKLSEAGDVIKQRDKYGVTVTRAAPPPAPEPEPGAVTIPADITLVERFLAAVPDLTPTGMETGCEAIDLLELDLATSSAKAFHWYRGEDPCPGDPYEVYVEVVNGQVTRTASCAELDQTGGCADYGLVRDEWSGKRVTTLAVSACNKPPDGVCIDAVSEAIRF